jgi:hypothetical protein
MGSAVTGQAIVDLQVFANRPAQLIESQLDYRAARSYLCIARRQWHKHADTPHPLRLLRMRRERPRHRRAAERG